MTRTTIADLLDRGRHPRFYAAHMNAFTARDRGHVAGMRLRDHNKGDLALTALTLAVAAAAAASEAARWAARRHRRGHRIAHGLRPTST